MKQESVVVKNNHIDVLWKDEEGNNHRKSYTRGRREEFSLEVEGFERFINLIDWTILPEENIDGK